VPYSGALLLSGPWAWFSPVAGDGSEGLERIVGAGRFTPAELVAISGGGARV
jgi:hypothetical protein